MENNVEKSYYERVKNYVALKPESTKIQVSAFIGVPIDFIEAGIANGEFEEHNGYLRVARKKGMKPVRRNELSKKFANDLHYEVKPLDTDSYKEPKSQLVVDLQKKYGIKINDENTR